MKKSFKILPLIFLMVVFFTGCTKVLNHYEDKLYSEKTLFGDKELNTKSTNVLTRENAIKKALNVFDKGLNIKIDRTNIIENVKLVKNDNIGNLQWQIIWNKAYGRNFYRCILDSSTGNILELEWFDDSIQKEGKVSKISELTDLEINNLIEPLFKELNINLRELNINNDNYSILRKSERIFDDYTSIILYNNKNKTSEYNIIIDLINKKVVKFEKIR